MRALFQGAAKVSLPGNRQVTYKEVVNTRIAEIKPRNKDK